MSPKKKKQFTAPEALFNLDEEQSVKTLHAKNNAKRATAWEAAEGADSEDHSDSTSEGDGEESDKSSQDLATDKAVETGDKSITWSSSSPSAGRLATHGAAGTG